MSNLKPLIRRRFAPAVALVQTAFSRLWSLALNVTLLAVAVLAAIALIVVQIRLRRFLHRQRAVASLLDAADALEARLRDARVEIEAITDSDQDPVRAAMQEMLRQRLWLKEHGSQASLTQLREVRDAIEAARERVERQLDRIDRARLPSSR